MISVVHPSRRRPEQAYATYQKWKERADGEFEYILSIDADDRSDYLGTFIGQRISIAPNRTAIEAINIAAASCVGDILVVVSDDTDCPEHWDTLLLTELEGKSDFVLKCKDGIQPVLVTMPIMDRVYYERYGYVYHPDFDHMGADVELTAVAIMTGKLLYSSLMFEHMHYSTGKSDKDAVNEKNDLTYAHGDSVLARHRVTNFGIESPVCTYESIDWHPTQVRLSILIATTAHRAGMLVPLLNSLTYQIGSNKEVEVLVDSDELECIGRKRNNLLGVAKGDYVVFIDDDDKIPNFYVSEILGAIETNPDCVGINGTISTNGWNFKKWYISREYVGWSEVYGVYYRTPNHISPVRRSIALQVGFPEIAHGEDLAYSQGLVGLLKTEVKIEEALYYYDYRTK